MTGDELVVRATLQELSAAIAAIMEDHAPTAARALPPNFVELARRFMVLRRAAGDISAITDGALALTRQFSASEFEDEKSL